MSNRLTRFQARLLGLVVLLTFAVGGVGLAALAAKDRLWADTFEVTLDVADASDLPPGTPVRIRGVDAGHVTLIDDTGDTVRVKLKLDAKYRGRLYCDATARVQPIGLLGSKAIAISPGSPAAGPHTTCVLPLTPTPDMAAVAEKLSSVADDASALLKDARKGTGTLAKLVNDDALYNELTAVAGRANGAVGKVEAETKNVSGLVAEGRDTLRSIKADTDAISRMPLVRNYVENSTALLVRPDCRKEQYDYNPHDLFEPGTAILHDVGRQHVENLAEVLKANPAKLELVVAALADPNDTTLTSAAALEITRKQAEVFAEALKDAKAHKTGFWTKNRPVTPLGLGFGPSPLKEPHASPSRVQVFAFQVQ